MRYFIFFLLFFSFDASIKAQSCNVNQIIFRTQSQVDSFLISNPTCTEITGNLRIRSSNINPITNLQGFKNIEKILGRFSMSDQGSVMNFTGLNALTFIGGDFEVAFNSNLKNFEGLQNLRNVGGAFTVRNNNDLASISALRSLENINSNSIHIFNNGLLTACNTRFVCQALDSLSFHTAFSSNGAGCGTFQQVCFGCPNENLVFKTQGQLDTFFIDFPYCDNFQYDIIVRESVAGEITNLHGFQNIKSIGGSLSIISNAALTDLSGLDSLDRISSFLSIFGNSNLQSLHGLDALRQVGGYVSIQFNPKLTSLDGLGSLQKTRGYLQIAKNATLTDLSSLGALTDIANYLWITENSMLPNLNGLNQLTRVGKGISIQDNPLLSNLLPLSNLVHFKGYLHIGQCPQLESLAGLEGISPDSISSLNILDNATLSVCNQLPFCQYLPQAIVVEVSGNALGCNSVGEILTACMVPALDIKPLDSGIFLFPSPAQDYFTIMQPESISVKNIRVYDAFGRLILEKMNEGAEQNWRIPCPEWPTGMYYLELFSENERVARKKVLIN